MMLRELVRAGVPRLLVPHIRAVVTGNRKYPRTNARFMSKLGQRFPYRETLLLDSGVFCFNVVQEAQFIFKTMENQGFKEESMTKVGSLNLSEFVDG
jgi:hypothetical protein